MRKSILILSAFALMSNISFAQDTEQDAKTKVKTKNGETKIKSETGDEKVKIETEKDGVTTIKTKKDGVKTKETLYTGNWKKTLGGLDYDIVKDVPGANMPKIGDHIEIHIHNYIGDSVLFDSRKMYNNQAVPLQIKAPSVNGDIVEGFMLMTPGDSAIFRVPIDSLKKAGVQLYPWMKEGDMIIYEVVLVSVKSPEQVKKEQTENAANQIGIDEKILQDYFKTNNIKPIKTASGLYYKINTPGTGENAKPGQQVTVNYTGKTTNGEAFDSNVDPKFNHVEPFTFGLGQGNVIRGWDEGVALMKKGTKATFYIPSTMAYGAQSPSPAIPANSVLIFDVEVTDIGNAPPPPPAPGHSDHDGHKH